MDLDDRTHEPYVSRAVELAEEAAERGDNPFGSLLLLDEDVVMEETNRVVTGDDLALHPELSLARRAESELSADERARAVMYTSTEPCPMCAAGIAFAGLGGVVFSVPFGSDPDQVGIPCEEVADRLGVDVAVAGPVLEAEGRATRRRHR